MARVIITGACGFIGSSLARALLSRGDEVIGIDNLARRGSEINADELGRIKGFRLLRIDITDFDAVGSAFRDTAPVDAFFHLAGQVAVTTSYQDRESDFQINAAGSFHVIEAVKRFSPEAYCLYASTNKVYGHVRAARPVGLDFPLDPYTPYGVSKAVGELYFSEFGREEIGLTTCSLRQSCIYGTRQYGVEDQGWVAWFVIANLLGLPVTIFGDGGQIRDLLYIDDLIELYLECWTKRLRGVWPVGGGPDRAISLRDGLAMIERASGRPFKLIRHEPVRPGDQPYFVADLSWRSGAGVTWSPRTTPEEGIAKMIEWTSDNEAAIRAILKV